MAHIATRSQGSYPIASVNSEFTELDLMAGEVSTYGLEYRIWLAHSPFSFLTIKTFELSQPMMPFLVGMC